MKFKIGDIVKVIKNEVNISIGKVGKVFHIDSEYISIDLDNLYNILFLKKELEHVTQQELLNYRYKK